MPDPVQVLSGGEVLLSGRAVLWLATALERHTLSLRANGVRGTETETWATVLAEAVVRQRTSDHGSAELPQASPSALSGLLEPITTAEAAKMLNTTPRNVVDLCRREALATARKVAGAWQIERAEVAARAELKAAS